MTITALAPASCAFWTLLIKLQSPLSINAIFPFIAATFAEVKFWQASDVIPPIPSETSPSVDPSFASTRSLIMAVFEREGPKAAAT